MAMSLNMLSKRSVAKEFMYTVKPRTGLYIKHQSDHELINITW